MKIWSPAKPPDERTPFNKCQRLPAQGGAVSASTQFFGSQGTSILYRRGPIESFCISASGLPGGGITRARLAPVDRRWIAGDYVLDYEVGDDTISITSIRHGRVKQPVLDLDEDFDFEAP